MTVSSSDSRPAWADSAKPSETLSDAVSAYLYRDVFPPVFNAAEDYLAGLRRFQAQNPTHGLTPGQHAYVFGLSARREARELRELESGLGVHTELRAVYSQIKGLEPFLERAKMLRAAQRISKLDTFPNGKRKPHRVKLCQRRMTRDGPMRDGQRVVEVVSSEDKMPRYSGVAMCGDLWCCPVCAPRATEARRRDLRDGALAWRRFGGQILLLNQTFPHQLAYELGPQWKRLSAARQHFARSAEVKRFREAVGYAGRIASREITYGCNGWHPHAHELVFITAPIGEETVDYWDKRLSRQWQSSCVLNDLDEPSLENGFRMSLTEVDEYIAKWGIDAELTKWHIKRGRVGDGPGELRLNGYTPFDLLRLHAGDLEAPAQLKLSTDRAAALFAEYAHAVAGTAQLHWSRGLKKRLEDAGADFDDDEANAPGDDDDRVVHGVLTAGDWFAIAHGDHQVEFLGLVHTKGWDYAQIFLSEWREECDRARRRRVVTTVRNASIASIWRGGP